MQLSRLRAILLSARGRSFSQTATASASQSADVPRLGPEITRRRLQDRFTTGPYEIPGEPRPYYPKRKSPFKRAGALINALQEEEGLRMVADGRSVFPSMIPDPRSGDIIRITYVQSLENLKMQQCFTGICIAVKKRGLGSTIVLRNVVEGVAVERGFPTYSPLIRNAELLGKKKVNRAKLYYLRDKPLRESTIPDATKKPKGMVHR